MDLSWLTYWIKKFTHNTHGDWQEGTAELEELIHDEEHELFGDGEHTIHTRFATKEHPRVFKAPKGIHIPL